MQIGIQARTKIIVMLAMAMVLVACAGQPPGSGTDPGQATQPGGAMQEGPVYISETELMLMESFPVQVALNLRGELPTPCHVLKYEVSEPDESNRIEVDMWSEAPAGQECIQVLEPFEERVTIGAFEQGEYEIFLNGERVAQFRP